MPTRQKRLVIAGGAFLFVVTLAWNLFSDARETSVQIAPSASATPPAEPAVDATAAPTVTPTTPTRSSQLEYSIAIAELDGLAPDVPPGTRFDLWVTWEPPLVEQTDVQPLLKGVELLRVIPPIVPEGPTVAVLGIPRVKESVRRLIFGDQFARLSVVRPATTGASSAPLP